MPHAPRHGGGPLRSRTPLECQDFRTNCCIDPDMVARNTLAAAQGENQAVAGPLSFRAVAGLSTPLLSHFRQVQWLVMENTEDALISQVCDKGLTLL